MLNHDDFEDLLDLYGPDLTRWPAHQAARAGMLLGASGRARAVWADAEMVALTLDTLYAEEPTGEARLADLAQAVEQIPQERVLHLRSWRAGMGLGLRTGALAASLLLGATLGWTVSEHLSSGTMAVDTVDVVELEGANL